MVSLHRCYAFLLLPNLLLILRYRLFEVLDFFEFNSSLFLFISFELSHVFGKLYGEIEYTLYFVLLGAEEALGLL